MNLKLELMHGFLKEIGAQIIQRGAHIIQDPYFVDFSYRSKDYYFVIDDALEDQVELWDWSKLLAMDKCLFKINLSDPESLTKLHQYMNSQ